jgi:hypothetical protein
MKVTTSIIALLFLLASITNGQTVANKKLHLYGSAGTKFLSSKTFLYSRNVSPSLASIIGGGAVRQKGSAQWGAEFFYSHGTSHLANYRSAYSGVTFNFAGGYCFDFSEKMKLSLQSGLGYSLNHLYVTDENYTSAAALNTAVFHNYSYTVPLSVMLQRVTPRGTFAGAKVGYHFNVRPSQWMFRESGRKQHFATDPEGFFIQLIFGGLLKLNR